MSIIESFSPAAATLGGLLYRYSNWICIKVIKILAVIVGLFLSAIACLQHQQIATINWNKLQQLSEHTITAFSNAITQIPAIGYTSDQSAASLTMTSQQMQFQKILQSIADI